jgi:hypothetical protein
MLSETKKQTVGPETEFNHTICRRVDSSAVMAIESSPDRDPKWPPTIRRYYKSPPSYAPVDHGRVFGHGLGTRSAMLVNVQPYSLIAAAERLKYGKGIRWQYFQLGSNFEVNLVPSRRRLEYNEIHEILKDLPEHHTASLNLSDQDLVDVFAGPQPEWFEVIAETQIEHWRKQNPECYARFAAEFPQGGDISRCIAAAPYTMLARWHDQMTEDQRQRCALRSPEGAVRFACDSIPPELREEYLRKHAKSALEHSLAKLSGPDLVVCASDKPKLAYEKRGNLDPERRAYVLATVYQFLWAAPFEKSPAQDQIEIIESVREHPEVWLSLHDWSFVRVFHELQRQASIRDGWGDLTYLNDHADPAVRHAFLDWVATQL